MFIHYTALLLLLLDFRAIDGPCEGQSHFPARSEAFLALHHSRRPFLLSPEGISPSPLSHLSWADQLAGFIGIAVTIWPK